MQYTINYLSRPIVSQDELEMMAPSNGFSLLGRQKKVGSSLSTLETTCCVLLDLKKEILLDQVNIHIIYDTFCLKSGKSAQVFTLL